MSTLAKILAVLCAVLFVITAIMALPVFNIEQKAFSSKTYKQAFERQKLYEQMPGILASALTESMAGKPGASAISQQDWEKILATLLPPDELQALTNEALDSAFDYLNGKKDSASISLLPFKQHMAGASGVETVKQILSAQPDCTEEQLTQMGANLISGGELLLCNPPAQLVDMFNPMIESQLQFMTAGIPDEVMLIKGNQNAAANGNDPRVMLSRVRRVMKWSPIVPLIFLFGLTIFAVRRLIDWLKWWGVPFIIIGAVTALLALLGASTLIAFVQGTLQNRGADSVPPAVLSVAQATIGSVAREILAPVVVQGSLIAVAGVVMVIVAAYLSNREKGLVPTN